MSEERIRVLLMGSGAFGVPSFAAVHDRHEVVGLVTQPSRPAGRRRLPTPTPAATWASEHGLAVWETDNVNDPAMIDQLQALTPDVALVIAFGQKLSDLCLDRLGGMAINLHASLLPAFRGAAPVQWAVITGQAATGNSVIALASTMDAGDILGVQMVDIAPTETAGELHDRLSAMAPSLVLDVIQRIRAGTLEPIKQRPEKATRAPKLSRRDAWVDFARPARDVAARINGLNPWPGVSVNWIGPEGESNPVMLRRARPLEEMDHSSVPGQVLDGLRIACGAGAIELLELQLPGKRLIDARSFLAGHQDWTKPGHRLECSKPEAE
ncbi:MAG: methionyl-tRNA formyltransferase [Phycisphaeraceae bacterium]|nr:methionyl-tRNA formyltransferase [Phycisphaeraceae bacterium]